MNSADKQIRTFTLQEDAQGVYKFILNDKFQDLVEKIAWSHCMFSNNGEYIIGGTSHHSIFVNLGSADKQKHNLYVWDIESAKLETVLEGPFESLDYFDV